MQGLGLHKRVCMIAAGVWLTVEQGMYGYIIDNRRGLQVLVWKHKRNLTQVCFGFGLNLAIFDYNLFN
jgi:hypothetical protein